MRDAHTISTASLASAFASAFAASLDVVCVVALTAGDVVASVSALAMALPTYPLPPNTTTRRSIDGVTFIARAFARVSSRVGERRRKRRRDTF